MADAAEGARRALDETLTDRHRQGRADYRNAHLTAMLRGQSLIIDPAKAAATRKVPPVEDLAAARAFVVSLPLGAAIWAVVIYAIWYFM